MPVGATIGAGALGAAGAIGSSLIQKSSAQDAQANQLAIYNRQQKELTPYKNLGSGAVATLAQLYGLGADGMPAGNPNFSAFTKSPDYQFAFDQGMDALTNQNAAKGMLQSGNNLKDVINYGQGAATQNYRQYVDQMMKMAGMGQNAINGSNALGFAGQQGQAAQNVGAAGAGGIVGATNAATGALGNYANLYTQQQNNQLLANAIGGRNSTIGGNVSINSGSVAPAGTPIQSDLFYAEGGQPEPGKPVVVGDKPTNTLASAAQYLKSNTNPLASVFGNFLGQAGGVGGSGGGTPAGTAPAPGGLAGAAQYMQQSSNPLAQVFGKFFGQVPGMGGAPSGGNPLASVFGQWMGQVPGMESAGAAVSGMPPTTGAGGNMLEMINSLRGAYGGSHPGPGGAFQGGRAFIPPLTNLATMVRPGGAPWRGYGGPASNTGSPYGNGQGPAARTAGPVYSGNQMLGYAAGGVPDPGQDFQAAEGGPEVIVPHDGGPPQVVGQGGPEVVTLDRPSTVIPNDLARAAMEAGVQTPEQWNALAQHAIETGMIPAPPRRYAAEMGGPDDMRGTVNPLEQARKFYEYMLNRDQGGVPQPADWSTALAVAPGPGALLKALPRAGAAAAGTAMGSMPGEAGEPAAKFTWADPDPERAKEMLDIQKRIDDRQRQILTLGTTKTSSPKGTQAQTITGLQAQNAETAPDVIRMNQLRADQKTERDNAFKAWQGEQDQLLQEAMEKKRRETSWFDMYPGVRSGIAPAMAAASYLGGHSLGKRFGMVPAIAAGAVSGGLEGALGQYVPTEMDMALPRGAPARLDAENDLQSQAWWNRLGAMTGGNALLGAYGAFRGAAGRRMPLPMIGGPSAAAPPQAGALSPLPGPSAGPLAGTPGLPPGSQPPNGLAAASIGASSPAGATTSQPLLKAVTAKDGRTLYFNINGGGFAKKGDIDKFLAGGP